VWLHGQGVKTKGEGLDRERKEEKRDFFAQHRVVPPMARALRRGGKTIQRGGQVKGKGLRTGQA